MIAISQNTFPASGGEFTIQITKSDYLLWTSVTVDAANWYRVISSDQVNIQIWELVVEVDENLVPAERRMGINVETEAEQEYFQIIQEAGQSTPAPEAFVESVSPEGNIGASGGTLTVEVFADNGTDALTSAVVSVGGSYVTLQSTTHGILSGGHLVTRFVFAFAVNSSSNARTATLQFTVSNGSQTDTVSITKTQEGTALTANVVASTPGGNIDSEGGSWVVDVQSVNGVDNLSSATVTGGLAYCVLGSTTHGVTSQGITVTRFVFNFAQNTGSSPRNGNVRITVSDGVNNAIINLSKSQDGAVSVPPTAEIRAESPTGDVGALGGLVVYDVRSVNGTDSLTTATIVSGGGFVSLQSTQHGILSEGYIITRFVFVVDANTIAQGRTFQIRFNVSDGSLTGSLTTSKNQTAAILNRVQREPNYSVLPWYISLDYQEAKKWWTYGKVYPLFTPAGYMLPFQIIREHRTSVSVTSFKVYRDDGSLVGDYTAAINSAGITIKQFADYDVIVFPGRLPVFGSMENGRYYATIEDGTEVWYSEIFTVVNDITPYLKLEWWDDSDFVSDGGTIVYDNPTFHNLLYLDSDIAKPEYKFEEEGETRDGYFFPTKQISEKTYRFSFWASEYLLDVIRLIRMADYVYITYNGKRFAADSFLITPEWENNGDIASVDAEFETATVAKKLGVGYVRSAGGGDYNNDFNDDYLN